MDASSPPTTEQQFRLLVQGVVDYAIYMLTPEGRVASWNAGAQRIKGYTQAEILGTHYSQFYTPEDREAGVPQRALDEAARNGRFEAEGWRVRKDGTRFWAHTVIDALRDPAGQLQGFAKITRDITEKREAERALEQARNELFQAQKMEALGHLTGGIAHDFNNLLSIISGAMEVLNAQAASALEKRVLGTVQRAIERGSSLTEQLLAFARKQPLVPAEFEVNRLIQDFEAVLRRAIPQAVELRFELAHQDCCVLVDETRFEAALLNLVVNARDAMPDGGVLTLRTELLELEESKTLSAGRYVGVTVADTGVGMSPEVRAKAFEPFFTTKPVGRGTGLGLPQVQGFIAQSGGTVELDSEPGKGTRVRILLPARERVEASNRPRAGSDTVLIVDDERDLAGLAGDLFGSLGYAVVTAGSADEALRALEQHPDTELLFADMVLPGMSGLDLARIVRQRFPAMRIILTSGFPLPVLREHKELSEFAFIPKPYRLSDIVKRLR